MKSAFDNQNRRKALENLGPRLGVELEPSPSFLAKSQIFRIVRKKSPKSGLELFLKNYFFSETQKNPHINLKESQYII